MPFLASIQNLRGHRLRSTVANVIVGYTDRMEQLTETDIPLVTVVGLAGVVVGWLGRGLAFVLRRWWTGSPKHDNATYLNSVADLATKLRANGMTIEDVRQLEAIMRNPTVAASDTANQVIEEMMDDVREPDAFQSYVAMKARMAAAHDVAEAKLEQALMDLRLLIAEHEGGALENAQDRWREYRTALGDCALREYEGGTHAPLAMIFAELSETERRTEEIRATIRERFAR